MLLTRCDRSMIPIKPFGIGVFAISLVVAPLNANACSWVTPPLVGYLKLSEVIVVGTITNANQTEATLTVESYLKGDRNATTLRVDNQTYDTGASCVPLTAIKGDRFPKGQRVLMFLDSETKPSGTKLWHPVGISDEAAFPLQQDRLLPGYLGLSLRHDPQPITPDQSPNSQISGAPLQSLSEVKEAMEQLGGPSKEVEIAPKQKSAQSPPLWLFITGGVLSISMLLRSTVRYYTKRD